MRLGLGALRLAPDAFWRMTPRELHAASVGLFGGREGPPSRAALDELMLMFPDTRRP